MSYSTTTTLHHVYGRCARVQMIQEYTRSVKRTFPAIENNHIVNGPFLYQPYFTATITVGFNLINTPFATVVYDIKILPLLRVRCFKVVGSLLSNQNTGMSENTTRIFIPHERSNSTQDFTTSSTRLVNTLDLRHFTASARYT